MCDICDAYIIVKGAFTVDSAENKYKKKNVKNYVPFTSCILKINITLKDMPKV